MRGLALAVILSLVVGQSWPLVGPSGVDGLRPNAPTAANPADDLTALREVSSGTGYPFPVPPDRPGRAAPVARPGLFFRPRVAQPRPKPLVVEVVPPPRGRRVVGEASWYCKAGRSVCHHSYPDGPGLDLYAAACGLVRRAVPSWRGHYATVSHAGRTIRVRLIDYCANNVRALDLYWDAAHALGITGVGRVTVYVN